jgi:predicted permease
METKRSATAYLISLLVFCTFLFFIVLFLLAPFMSETISLSREYGFEPDSWTYYAILGCCVVALIASLFLLFHQYLVRGRNRGRCENP